ncbi:MAG: hypothetical protein E7Z62_08810 [Thermoplasmata archaeon]|nr:hypothetical protein [Thermoplasmata archaeon]
MVTEKDIDRFVSDNKEIIERMMSIQKDNAELAKRKGEELIATVFKAFLDPDVQRHFMASGFEILAGLTALVQASPTPDFIKDAVSDFDKNLRVAACRTNEDCLVKRKIKIAEPAEETVE